MVSSPSPAAPAFRASLTKSLLQVVEKAPQVTRDLILAQLAGDELKLVRDTVGIGWIPARIHTQLNRASWSVLGSASLREAWREAYLAIAKTAILRPLILGAQHMFGMSPRSVARWTEHGWKAVTRDFGQVRFVELDPAQNRVQLVLELVPLQFPVPGPFAIGLAGVFEGFISGGGNSGSVCIVSEEPGRAVFELAWSSESS
jgi:hypothetical protein